MKFSPSLYFILFFIVCNSAAYLYANDTTTVTKIDSIQLLQKRIDSIHVEIAHIKMNKIEQNPLASGEYLKWGKGFFGEVTLGGAPGFMSEIDLGYMFTQVPVPKFMQKDYIGNLRKMRIGLSFGLIMGLDNLFISEEFNVKDTVIKLLQPAGILWGGTSFKLYMGSPILLNLLSCMNHLQFICFQTLTSDQNNYAINLGSTIEMWFTKSSNVYIGFQGIFPIALFEDASLENTVNYDTYYFDPVRIEICFGSRFYF